MAKFKVCFVIFALLLTLLLVTSQHVMMKSQQDTHLSFEIGQFGECIFDFSSANMSTDYFLGCFYSYHTSFVEDIDHESISPLKCVGFTGEALNVTSKTIQLETAQQPGVVSNYQYKGVAFKFSLQDDQPFNTDMKVHCYPRTTPTAALMAVPLVVQFMDDDYTTDFANYRLGSKVFPIHINPGLSPFIITARVDTNQRLNINIAGMGAVYDGMKFKVETIKPNGQVDSTIQFNSPFNCSFSGASCSDIFTIQRFSEDADHLVIRHTSSRSSDIIVEGLDWALCNSVQVSFDVPPTFDINNHLIQILSPDFPGMRQIIKPYITTDPTAAQPSVSFPQDISTSISSYTDNIAIMQFTLPARLTNGESIEQKFVNIFTRPVTPYIETFMCHPWFAGDNQRSTTAQHHYPNVLQFSGLLDGSPFHQGGIGLIPVDSSTPAEQMNTIVLFSGLSKYRKDNSTGIYTHSSYNNNPLPYVTYAVQYTSKSVDVDNLPMTEYFHIATPETKISTNLNMNTNMINPISQITPSELKVISANFTTSGGDLTHSTSVTFQWKHYGLWNVNNILELTIENSKEISVAIKNLIVKGSSINQDDRGVNELCYVENLTSDGSCEFTRFRISGSSSDTPTTTNNNNNNIVVSKVSFSLQELYENEAPKDHFTGDVTFNDFTIEFTINNFDITSPGDVTEPKISVNVVDMNIRAPSGAQQYVDNVQIWPERRLSEITSEFMSFGQFNMEKVLAPAAMYNFQVPEYAVVSLDISNIFYQWITTGDFSDLNNIEIQQFPQINMNQNVFHLSMSEGLSWMSEVWSIDVIVKCSTFDSESHWYVSASVDSQFAVTIQSNQDDGQTMLSIARQYMSCTHDDSTATKSINATLHAKIYMPPAQQSNTSTDTVWSILESNLDPSSATHLPVSFHVQWSSLSDGVNESTDDINYIVWVKKPSDYLNSVITVYDAINQSDEPLIQHVQNLLVPGPTQTPPKVLNRLINNKLQINIQLAPYHQKYFVNNQIVLELYSLSLIDSTSPLTKYLYASLELVQIDMYNYRLGVPLPQLTRRIDGLKIVLVIPGLGDTNDLLQFTTPWFQTGFVGCDPACTNPNEICNEYTNVCEVIQQTCDSCNPIGTDVCTTNGMEGEQQQGAGSIFKCHCKTGFDGDYCYDIIPNYGQTDGNGNDYHQPICETTTLFDFFDFALNNNDTCFIPITISDLPSNGDDEDIKELPSTITTLPTNLPSLDLLCQYVIDVANTTQVYNEQYSQMCSIPTAGQLLIRGMSNTNNNNTDNNNNKGVCDCKCNGYWQDDITNKDYKKCTKCSLQCPPLFIQNEECTACQCTTTECLSAQRYYFNTIYYDLAILHIIQQPNISNILNTGDYQMYDFVQYAFNQYQQNFISTNQYDLMIENRMTFVNEKYFTNISTKNRNLYYNILSTQLGKAIHNEFAIKVNQTYKGAYNDVFRLGLQSILLQPLIQGNYLIWKVTYITNPTVVIKYKMNDNDLQYTVTNMNEIMENIKPLNNIQIGTLLHNIIKNTLFDTAQGIANGNTSNFTLSTQIISNLLRTSDEQFYTNDKTITKCIPYDYVENGIYKEILTTSNKQRVIHNTADQQQQQNQIQQHSKLDNEILNSLQPCPKSHLDFVLYIKEALNNDGNPALILDDEKTKENNPLWSNCTKQSYLNYDNIWNTDVETIYTRHIYPLCVDFTGRLLSGEENYYIPCNYEHYNENFILPTSPQTSMNNETYINTLLYYSQSQQQLYIPQHLQRIMNSINLHNIDNSTVKGIDFTTRIIQYKSLTLPTYPSYPLINDVICSPIEYESISINEQQQSTVPSIIPQHIIASPSLLQTGSHTHLIWDVLPYNNTNTNNSNTDAQLTMTFTLSPVMNNNNVLSNYINNNNQQQQPQQFGWSQILSTTPISTSFVTTALPNVEQSVLFQQLYKQIALQKQTDDGAFQILDNNNVVNSNNDLLNLYQNATVIMNGFITEHAQISTSTNQQQQQQIFTLPLLCQQNNVTCANADTQYCNESTGRCECKWSHYTEQTQLFLQSTQYRRNYTTLINIDGNELQCLPKCQNGGIYNITTSKCDCTSTIPFAYGDYCEIVDICNIKMSNTNTMTINNNNIDNNITTMNCTNGYYSFDSEIQECDTSICHCYPNWTYDDEGNDNQCTKCLLQPLQNETRTNQTYIDNNIEQQQQQQRCYITGTLKETYTNGQCQKCLCKLGYSGDYCQLHTTYVKLQYKSQIKYKYDNVNELLLNDKLSTELSLSLTKYDKSQIFIFEHNLQQKYIIIAIQSGLDYFKRNADLEYQATLNTNPSSFSVLSSTIFLQPLQTTTVGQNNINNLYQQWLDLQQNYNNTPINNQDTNNYLGGGNGKGDSSTSIPATPPYDPSCKEQGYTNCSPTSSYWSTPKKSTDYTSIIIAIVVVFSVVLIIFIITIILVRYARKSKKWCFEEKKKNKTSSHKLDENGLKYQDNSYKGSTHAPSQVGSTISLMPLSATQQTTTTTTDNIKSVNNHKEIDDPSLINTDWKAYQDSKYNKFYVNTKTMESSWKHPITGEGKDDMGW